MTFQNHIAPMLLALATLFAVACSHRTEARTGAAFESAGQDITRDTHVAGASADREGHKVSRAAHDLTH